MRFALTGATGLLGGNLAVVLAEAGHQVRATRRATSRTDHVDAPGVEWVEASLGDVDSLERAFDGCDGVFHCAATFSNLKRRAPLLRTTNVGGTGNVIEAVRRVGGPRLVHCSSASAIGVSEDGTPCDEGQTWNLARYELVGDYVATKREAEEVVLAAAADGLDAVVVNPGFMIGPRDRGPSSGKLVMDLVAGKMAGYTGGANCFVDVRDVARGMLLAFERGRSGERYILGGHNLGYKAFFDMVTDLAGVPPVKRRIPAPLARLAGWFGDLGGWLTGREPIMTTHTIRWAQCPRFILSSAKAESALGYTISPLEGAVEDALAWFRAHGMLPAPAGDRVEEAAE